MGKLQEMKQKADEIKKNLDGIVITSESMGGNIKIEINGNRKIKSLDISEGLKQGNKKELESYLVSAINKAVEAADKTNEDEMKKAATGLLPGF